jgi:hypothetical protein
MNERCLHSRDVQACDEGMEFRYSYDIGLTTHPALRIAIGCESGCFIIGYYLYKRVFNSRVLTLLHQLIRARDNNMHAHASFAAANELYARDFGPEKASLTAKMTKSLLIG